MDILGIGPLEFVFILLIALIVLGPKDMIKAGKTLGRALRAIVTSDTWRVVQQASREVRNLPNRLIREAGIDELQKQLPTASTLEKELGLNEIGKSIQQSASADLSPWTTPPTSDKPFDSQAKKEDGQQTTQEAAQTSREAETPPLASQDVPEEPATVPESLAERGSVEQDAAEQDPPEPSQADQGNQPS